jgi:hypothetical protein
MGASQSGIGKTAVYVLPSSAATSAFWFYRALELARELR